MVIAPINFVVKNPVITCMAYRPNTHIYQIYSPDVIHFPWINPCLTQNFVGFPKLSIERVCPDPLSMT